jgi:hypothetical protein
MAPGRVAVSEYSQGFHRVNRRASSGIPGPLDESPSECCTRVLFLACSGQENEDFGVSAKIEGREA